MKRRKFKQMMRHSADFHARSRPSIRIEHFHVTSLPPCWREQTIHFLSPMKQDLFSCKCFHCFSPPTWPPCKCNFCLLPLKEPCEVEAAKSTKHISKNIARSLTKFLIISVELMYFLILSNPFRKRSCKHESKRKSSDEIPIMLIE